MRARYPAELWLDDLLLTGETITPDGTRFTIDALAADMTLGTAEPIEATVQRWMADGAITTTQGYGNRQPAFSVVMSANTPEALYVAERALVKAARSAQELRWISLAGAPDAAASVFDLQTCHPSHQLDIEDEKRLERTWQIALEAWPWVRSDTLVTVDALTVGITPTLTDVDSCSSASGWAGGSGVTVTSSGGAVRVTRTVPANGHGNHVGLALTRTSVVSGMGTTPYLVLDMAVTGGTATPQVFLDGVQQVKSAQIGTVSYWKVPDGVTSFTTLQIMADVAGTKGKPATLSVNDVAKSDTVDPTSTRKQLTRSLDVGGSMPTSGSIKVASPSNTPLKTVLVYSRTDDGSGFVPNMRQYRFSGPSVLTDATTVTGKKDQILNNGTPTAGIGFTVPPGLVREASYTVLGRWYTDTVGSMVAALEGGISGTGFSGYGLSTLTGQIDFDVANTWVIRPLGVITLPQTTLPAESLASTFLAFNAVSGPAGADIFLDELWLIDKTRGAVSIIDCGSTATRLWLDSPNADRTRNRPAVYIGTLDDRSDAAGAPSSNIHSLGQHLLDPDGEILFTVTDGVADAKVSASFYPAGHTNMGNRP